MAILFDLFRFPVEVVQLAVDLQAFLSKVIAGQQQFVIGRDGNDRIHRFAARIVGVVAACFNERQCRLIVTKIPILFRRSLDRGGNLGRRVLFVVVVAVGGEGGIEPNAHA